MPTISFSKTEKPAQATEVSSDAKAAAPQQESTKQENQVATQNRQVGFAANTNQFVGSWDQEDVRLPRINLVHKTSAAELIEAFGIGGFCFNKEVRLSDGKTPIVVTALRAAKDYIQKVEFGDSEMPTVYRSPEEVLANGGSLNRKDQDNGNFFQPRAHIQFVLKAPDEISEAGLALFPYEFDGAMYAKAVLTVASSAYTSTAKEIATLCNNNIVMRKGPQFGSLNLISEPRTSARYSWVVPVVKFKGANTPEFIAFCEGLL